MQVIMLSNPVIFLAFLCAVNAYVGVNIYDSGDVDTARLSDARSCNNQECDQLCRRIGFPSGVCVNDRCKCDILLKTEDNEIPSAPADAEAVESGSKKAAAMQGPSPVVMPMPRACFAWQCINTCRAAGYLNGYCQFNSCICY